MEEYFLIREFLKNWQDSIIPEEEMKCQACERMRIILFDLKQGGSISKGDFSGLLRHYMGKYFTICDCQNQVIYLSKNEIFPDRINLEASHINIKYESEFYFVLSLQEWKPEWILNNHEVSPLISTYSHKKMRPDFKVELDPAVKKVTQFVDYFSLGQREAVRSYFNSSAGSSLVLSIPTGSGKSLLTQLTVLLTTEFIKLTIVVVPTVALAIDQEKELNKINNTNWIDCAYYGGMDETKKEEIRKNIKRGLQKIIFTSPEALLTSLLISISISAKKGYLGHFIVDEAHMIDEWGNAFRPDFQKLAALRKRLFELCPDKQKFKSLYLTATLTKEAYGVLNDFFNDGEEIPLLWANYIRREPSYYVAKAGSREDKVAKLKEIVNVVPRPFIFYASLPVDYNFHPEIISVQEWLTIFQEMGIYRVRTFTGLTDAVEREKIIDEWMNNKIDCIIATSAFGVGMNKSDIRTVIHACVPENANRFYQEVGRTGRDGYSSLSFTIYTNEDYRYAKSIANQKIITLERARDRWDAMRTNAEVENGELIINLNTLPPNLHNEGDKNFEWNLKTVLLMQKTGLIEVKMPDLNKILDTNYDNEVNFEETLRLKSHSLIIYLLKDINDNTWANRSDLDNARNSILNGNKDGFNSMSKLLECNEDFCSLFRNLFTLELNQPIGTCSGCPKCGYTQLASFDSKEDFPYNSSLNDENYCNLNSLNLKPMNGKFLISYEDLNVHRVHKLVSILSEVCKFSEYATDDDELLKELEQFAEKDMPRISSVFNYLKTENHDTFYSKGNRISIVRNCETLPVNLANLERNVHVIVFHQDTKAGINDNRRIIDIYANKVNNLSQIFQENRLWEF